MNQMGGQGQPAQEWQTEVFRSSLVRKLEEAIRDSGNPPHKPATDMERQVFLRAKTKEEYLSYIARLILHVRQQSSGQQGGGGDLDLGGMQPMQHQQQMQQQMQQQGQMRMQQMQGQQQMNMGMSMQQQQQQQQQRMMLQQQQQQRMMLQQQQQNQMAMQQRPQMSQQSMLEQRLQQQQQGGVMNRARMPVGQMGPRGPMGPGMGRPGPPPYITGPTAGPGQAQGPSPVPHYSQSSPGHPMNPSPGQARPVPSPGGMAPTPSPGGGINSNVNTPMGAAPDSVADREYMDKVKQLEKYIEPLRRMITKIGTEDQDRLAKMKKLLEILSNPEKRMPLATLQKCEDVLKKMNLPDIEPGPECGEGGQGTSQSVNPLLEAVLKARSNQGAHLNHSLSRTFLPPLRAVVGQEITLAPLPASPPDSEGEDEIPDVLQGEIARLEPRFKVWLSNAQPSGTAGTVRVVCQLDDQDLPAVPTIEVTLPSDYPDHPPVYSGSEGQYLTTPFLTRVEEAFDSRCMRLPPRHTLTQLLTAWELSVRAACCINSQVPTLPAGASMFSV